MNDAFKKLAEVVAYSDEECARQLQPIHVFRPQDDGYSSTGSESSLQAGTLDRVLNRNGRGRN